MQWRNWADTVRSRAERAEPASEQEVAGLVRRCARSGHKLRVAGAGHSFTRLVETDGVLVSLDRMQGLLGADPAAGRATVQAGTRLHRLGELLAAQGLAQENLGDIDVQSLAGALSTGTHGTGSHLGILATQLAGMTLIDGQGEKRRLTPDDGDLFRAAQVSLGALGVITRMELRVVPAYRLRFRSERGHLEETLERVGEYRDRHRNFEFYWFPHSDFVQLKLSDTTDEPPAPPGRMARFVDEMLMENGAFWCLSQACRAFPSLTAPVSRLSGRMVPVRETVDASHRVYATRRLVRFREMEYNIPRDALPAVLRRVRDTIRAQRIRVHFPVECRYVAGDDITISPAHGRDSAYVAVHMFKGMPYREYFSAIEPIFLEHGGRPHWGKMHTRTAATLRSLYPQWDRFLEAREQLDPRGTFLTPYLRELLGV